MNGMNKKILLLGSLLLLMMLMIGCSTLEPIFDFAIVEEIDIIILELFPVQVYLVASGYLADYHRVCRGVNVSRCAPTACRAGYGNMGDNLRQPYLRDVARRLSLTAGCRLRAVRGYLFRLYSRKDRVSHRSDPVPRNSQCSLVSGDALYARLESRLPLNRR